jgi:Putative prokaryotic signal transducing protein
MSGRFVIVHRTYDPIQADILGDLLRSAGVNARVTGTRSGALVGVAQNIIEVHIAVPESQAGDATDFLEAYFSAETVDEEGSRPADEEEDAEVEEPASTSGSSASSGTGLGARSSEQDGDEDEVDASDHDVSGAARKTRRPANLRPLLAAGCAFLTFGVGHLYARRPWTAGALLIGQVVAMVLLFAGDSWTTWTAGLTALMVIVGCDVVGSVLATRAHRSGVRRGRAWQGAVGALYVGAAIVLAIAVGPRLTDPNAGNPTGGWRHTPDKSPLERLDRPLQRDPSFPPLTSDHPANPAARR